MPQTLALLRMQRPREPGSAWPASKGTWTSFGRARCLRDLAHLPARRLPPMRNGNDPIEGGLGTDENHAGHPVCRHDRGCRLH